MATLLQQKTLNNYQETYSLKIIKTKRGIQELENTPQLRLVTQYYIDEKSYTEITITNKTHFKQHQQDQQEQSQQEKENEENKKKFIGELYEKFWNKLTGSLKRFVHCEDIAKDIAHDAFIRISALPQPQTLEFPYAYLYRTAVNLIKDRAKAMRVREDYKQYLSLDQDSGVDTLSPEHYLLGQEKLTTAIKAIEALPPKCRKVFLLHKVDRMSHKDIAKMIGISKCTVEKHIMRAMARCQSAY